eukprot:jgi/Hompol1/6312/HPOL_004934-RA
MVSAGTSMLSVGDGANKVVLGMLAVFVDEREWESKGEVVAVGSNNDGEREIAGNGSNPILYEPASAVEDAGDSDGEAAELRACDVGDEGDDEWKSENGFARVRGVLGHGLRFWDEVGDFVVVGTDLRVELMT